MLSVKKINKNLIIAIIWIIVACFFFGINKIWVGMTWLLVGVIHLMRGVRTYQMNNEMQAISKHLDEIVDIGNAGENDNKPKTVMETIKTSKEVHVIYDEYIGYGYIVNKAFKPAKSHAAEVELLCTYAPNDEYGTEGNSPSIAVQTDDEVYCAVEQYKENKTFDGCISIEPLEGTFMFKAKREYYGEMMYFYGFELEGEEYWDKAGLCLVYAKEYVGTKEEEKLMNILDEAAKSFNKNL